MAMVDPSPVTEPSVRYPAPIRCQSKSLAAYTSKGMYRRQGRKSCVAKPSVPAHTTAPGNPQSPSTPERPQAMRSSTGLTLDNHQPSIEQQNLVDIVLMQHASLGRLGTSGHTGGHRAPDTPNPLVKQIADLAIRLSQAESALAEAQANVSLSTTSQTCTQAECKLQVAVSTSEVSVQTDFAPSCPVQPELHELQTSTKTPVQTNEKTGSKTGISAGQQQKSRNSGQGPWGFLAHMFTPNTQAGLMDMTMLQCGEIRQEDVADYGGSTEAATFW